MQKLTSSFQRFTFGSPPDDAHATSDGKRKHPLLSTCRSTAFPQRIRLGEDEGEMLGRQAPLPKNHPRWHVHFLSRDEKTTESVLFLPDTPATLAVLVASPLPRCLHVLLLPLWRTSSPLRCAFPRYTGNRCRLLLLLFFFKESFREKKVEKR